MRGFVLVAMDSDPNRLPSGLWLGVTSETERPKILWGTVLAVGPGDRRKKGDGRKPMMARVGARVGINRKSAWLELEDSERAVGQSGREVLMVHDSQLELEC